MITRRRRWLATAVLAGGLLGGGAAVLASSPTASAANACVDPTHVWSPDLTVLDDDPTATTFLYSDASNWRTPGGGSVGAAPGVGDRACIGAADFYPTVAGDVVAGDVAGKQVKVTYQGTLDVRGELDLETLDVNGGTVRGSGTSTVDSLFLTGGARITDHAVTATALASDNFQLDAGAVLTTAGTVADADFEPFVQVTGGAQLRFTGDVTVGDQLFAVDYDGEDGIGDLVVAAGASLTLDQADVTPYVATGIVNDGLVEVKAGKLNLSARSSAASTGQFLDSTDPAVDDGLRIGYASTDDRLRLGTGASITGGAVSGPVEVSGAVTMTDAELSGDVTGAGTLTFEGTSRLSGGKMAGTGRTVVAADAELVSTYAYAAGDRVVEVLGTLTMTNSSTIYVEDSGSFLVRGLLDLDGSVYTQSLTPETAAGIQVTATGELRQSGPADTSTSIYVPLDSAGLISTTSGSLTLNRPGANPLTGRLDGAPGTTLGVQGSPAFRLGNGVVLDGVDIGDVTIPAGTAQAVDSRLNGQVDGPGVLAVSDSRVSYLVLPAGATVRVADASDLEVVENGVLYVQGGLVDVRGRLLVGQGATVYFYLDTGGRVDVTGTLRLADGGDVGCLGECGTVRVAPGAVLERQGAVDDVSTLDANLDNDGLVVARSGQLQVNPYGYGTTALPVSDGRFAVDGGSLRLGRVALGTGSRVEGATITGDVGTDARAVLADATVDGGTLSGAGTFVVEDTLTVAGGTFDGTATTLVPVGAHVDLGNAYLTGGHDLVVRGTGRLATDVTLAGGSALEVRGEVELADASIGGGGTLAVFGTLREDGATSQSSISSSLVNEGTVLVEGEGLSLYADAHPYDCTLLGGTWHVRTTFWPGCLSVNAATLVLDGPAASLEGHGISRNAATGVLDLRGGASLSTGDLENRGAVRLGPGSTLDVEGTYRQRDTGTLVAGVDTGAQGLVQAEEALLAGGVTVARASAYAPAVATRHVVVSAPSVSGTFSRVRGAEVASDRRFVVEYDADSADLVVVDGAQAAPPALTTLAAPTAVQAAPAGTGVDLTWTRTSGASTTVVMREGTRAPRSVSDGKVVYRGTARRVSVRGLRPGVSYTFGVLARTATGTSRIVAVRRHGTAIRVSTPARARVVDTATGRGLGGVRVVVQRWDAKTVRWVRVGVATTNATGTLRLDPAVTGRPGRHRAVFGGTGPHLPTRTPLP